MPQHNPDSSTAPESTTSDNHQNDSDATNNVIDHDPATQRLLDADTQPSVEQLASSQAAVGAPDHPPASPSPIDRSPHMTAVGIWWREILVCLLAVVALIALITLLCVVDGRPLPNLPFALSVNSLVAIFIAIFQASTVFIATEGISQLKWTWYQKPHKLHDFLVYDNASRGPWGALEMLWHLKTRSIVATLGVIVIVAALILDPVSQQLIQLDNCHQVLPIQAGISRTNFYDEERRLFNQHIPDSTQNLGLVSAAAVGQFSSSPPPVHFSCSTGNCTFLQQYSSIGYCSKCTDILAYLNVSLNSLAEKGCGINMRLGPLPVVNSGGQLSCTATINGTFTSNFTRTQSINLPLFQSIYEKCLGSALIVWYNYTSSPSNSCDKTVAARAYQCQLTPCVHTFEATIENGQLNETVLSRELAFGPPESLVHRYGNVADLDCAGNEARIILSQLGYEFNSTSKWIRYNVTWNLDRFKDTGPYYWQGTNLTRTPAGLANGLYQQNGTKWLLSDKALQAVPLQCIYYVDYSTALNTEVALNRYSGDQLISAFSEGSGFDGTPTALSLYDAVRGGKGNDSLAAITALAQNMTDAMTTYMRWHGNPNASQAAEGETRHYAVCIAVSWSYIAYVSTVTAMVLAFFAATVVKTRTAQANAMRHYDNNSSQTHNTTGANASFFHDFKSNSLAVLYHGFDQQTRDALIHTGSTNRVAELENESKKDDMFVLVQTKQGWRLSLVDRGRASNA